MAWVVGTTCWHINFILPVQDSGYMWVHVCARARAHARVLHVPACYMSQGIVEIDSRIPN